VKSFVFSIEALLSLAAMTALAGYSAADAGLWHGEVRMAQLVQDLLEITVKNQENIGGVIELHATGKSDFLEKKYSSLLEQLGNYCLGLEVEGRVLKVNCAQEPGRVVSGERIVLVGNEFAEVRLSLGPR